MRFLDLINIYSLDFTIKDLAKYIFSLLGTQSYSILMMHLDNLVLNSIHQLQDQFYTSFHNYSMCFSAVKFLPNLQDLKFFLKNDAHLLFFDIAASAQRRFAWSETAVGLGDSADALMHGSRGWFTGRPTLRSAEDCVPFSPSLWKYHQEACNSQAR